MCHHPMILVGASCCGVFVGFDSKKITFADAAGAENAPIYVTRPSLPDLDDVLPLLENLWDSRILTNRGPLLRRLEVALCDYLGVAQISLVANATQGLILALRQAGITSGEVITTPFTFVATAHAIKLAGATPVFADIEPDTLNLDPQKVTALITPETRAIMPVHTFGRPCNMAGLAQVASENALPIIYDAAHAFGVTQDGKSILQQGTMSVLSFHATKVFNTFEGGAVVSSDLATKEAIDRLANFGFATSETVDNVGTNAKMHELSAAVGLAHLCGIDDVLDGRTTVARRYTDKFEGVPGLQLLCPGAEEGRNSYAYPILIGDEFRMDRDTLHDRLATANIFARRYFYPLVSDLSPYKDLASSDPAHLSVARKTADQVICLPLYHDLEPAAQNRIIDIVLHG